MTRFLERVIKSHRKNSNRKSNFNDLDEKIYPCMYKTARRNLFSIRFELKV